MTAPTISRRRLLAFVLVVVAIATATAAYLVTARHDDGSDATSATQPLTRVETRPRIVFRNEMRYHYGVVAMVTLDDPDGARALTSRPCARLYSAADGTVCVSLNKLSILYESHVLDRRFRDTRELQLGGIPSRARLSRDGRFASTTAFTAVGDSYASSRFSTRTFVTDLRSERAGTSLEDFTLIHRGRAITPVDRNFWGVTFADDDNLFYATVQFDGRTWLVV
ncbi:MAG: hypothetical protein INR72_19295, partial [Williamsia herbipolensis]|nr:hypothetical protein [Williamsia herbipolensis]